MSSSIVLEDKININLMQKKWINKGKSCAKTSKIVKLLEMGSHPS